MPWDGARLPHFYNIIGSSLPFVKSVEPQEFPQKFLFILNKNHYIPTRFRVGY